jgi:1-acyl-sn-glycerol-3-phosphate acyltransferase
LSICIFPEGGVPDDESIVLDTFKDGAFRAWLLSITITPISFLETIKEDFIYFFF